MLCIAGERPVLGELANTRFRTRHRRRRDRRPCRIPPGGGTAPQKRLEATLHAPGKEMMVIVMMVLVPASAECRGLSWARGSSGGKVQRDSATAAEPAIGS